MERPDENEFLDLVYGAAAAPELWPCALERFADMIGGTSAWISRLNMIDGTGSVLTTRIDPVMPTLYFEHYADRNPLSNVSDPQAYMETWVPRILTDEDWMPKAELERSEFYNGFMRPQDVHSVLMVRLAADDNDVCVVNVARSRRREQFGGADLELAGRLHPHLIRAFELGRKLALGQRMTGGFATVFDESAHGLFLLDGDGCVRQLNRVAEALVAARKGLQICGGRLSAVEADAARALQALIGRAALRKTSGRTGGSMSLAVASSAVPLSVMVAPVPLPNVAILSGASTVLVCVTDSQADVRLPAQKLRDLFGLTRAEARTALALFEGATPRQAAEAMGVSPNTVNNHLARVFEKTGTHRQSGLIRLMMRLVDLNLGPGTRA
jgi:DNA-binding CsgD family transcriptional regulator/PAS domain-containing protein